MTPETTTKSPADLGSEWISANHSTLLRTHNRKWIAASADGFVLAADTQEEFFRRLRQTGRDMSEFAIEYITSDLRA